MVNRKKSSRTARKSSQIICSEMKIVLKSLVSRKTIVQKENIKKQISVITARENSVNNERALLKIKLLGVSGRLAHWRSTPLVTVMYMATPSGSRYLSFLFFFSSTFFFCRLSQRFWYLLYLKIIKYSKSVFLIYYSFTRSSFPAHFP